MKRPRFIQTVVNIFSIPDLRTRIINTLVFLVVFRLGSFIVLPGVNTVLLEEKAKSGGESSGMMGLIDTFSGGAFSQASILGLGIMPYITASIVLQLLTFAIPYFQKLQKEGESGRKKINQYTRMLTIAIAAVQGVAYISTYVADSQFAGAQGGINQIVQVVCLVAGTMFSLWLGEKITDKGIGNGVSMLIMIGIVSRLPASFLSEVDRTGMISLVLLLEIVALFFIIMLVVLLTQAVRRIPIQHVKQQLGNAAVGGQRQYLPIKLLTAGVMPIIFAQSVMFLPGLLTSVFQGSSFAYYLNLLSDPRSFPYNVTICILIILFTFFYTAIVLSPKQISEDLKRNGGFIPGVKPGEATSEYIDDILTKITFPGALFISLIAIMPSLAMLADIQQSFAYFFGGTSLLIMVGVILDTLQQIDSYLLMRHYDGMMKSGKIKGRTQNPVLAS